MSGCVSAESQLQLGPGSTLPVGDHTQALKALITIDIPLAVDEGDLQITFADEIMAQISKQADEQRQLVSVCSYRSDPNNDREPFYWKRGEMRSGCDVPSGRMQLHRHPPAAISLPHPLSFVSHSLAPLSALLEWFKLALLVRLLAKNHRKPSLHTVAA